MSVAALEAQGRRRAAIVLREDVRRSTGSSWTARFNRSHDAPIAPAWAVLCAAADYAARCAANELDRGHVADARAWARAHVLLREKAADRRLHRSAS